MFRVPNGRSIGILVGALVALVAAGGFALRGSSKARASSVNESPKLGMVTADRPASRTVGEQVTATRLFALEQRLDALEGQKWAQPASPESAQPEVATSPAPAVAEPLPNVAAQKVIDA